MEYKQDMPPPGGYAPITYKRVPLKSGLSPKVKLLLAVGVSGLGMLGLRHDRRQLANERIENRCTDQALYPMLLAEVDRMQLKQLKKNREMEEEIMKDVKGWEVGKWKGFPVYSTLDPDEYFRPDFSEYFAHTAPKYKNLIRNVIKNS